jgi:hypothetical protein
MTSFMHRRLAQLPFIQEVEIKEIETANRYIERLHKRCERLIMLADMMEVNDDLHAYFEDVEQIREQGTVFEFLTIVKIFANLFADLYIDHEGDESLLSEGLTVYSKMRKEITWFYKRFRFVVSVVPATLATKA